MTSGPTISPGMAGKTTVGGWHPTVLWMFGFIVVEIIAFGYLGRLLKL